MKVAKLLAAALFACTTFAQAAVVTVNTTDSRFNSAAMNQGWWNNQDYVGSDTSNSIYTGGQLYDDITLRSFFSFDLSNVQGTITGASLRVMRGSQSTIAHLGLWDVSTDAATVNFNDGVNAAIWEDLGSGNSYGQFLIRRGDRDDFLTLDLNATALADLNAATGYFTIGAAVGNDQFIFSGIPSDLGTFLDLTIADSNTVPEPGTATLLLSGLAAAVASRRRRRKQ